MKVIIIKSVKNLGAVGAVLDVKEGYARNYLLPNKIVVPFSEIDLQKIQLAAKLAPVNIDNTVNLVEAIEGKKITIQAGTNDGKKLYAGIPIEEIIKQVKLQLGINLEEKNLKQYHSIKEIGQHEIVVSEANRAAKLTVTIKAKKNANK